MKAFRDMNIYEQTNYVLALEKKVILIALLPGGKFHGDEYVALNPTRDDKHLGSFRVNVHIGKWADFATGDRGGDLISLYAYLKGVSQKEAALQLSSFFTKKRRPS